MSKNGLKQKTPWLLEFAKNMRVESFPLRQSFSFRDLQYVTTNWLPNFNRFALGGAVLGTGGNMAVTLYRQVGKGKARRPGNQAFWETDRKTVASLVSVESAASVASVTADSNRN